MNNFIRNFQDEIKISNIIIQLKVEVFHDPIYLLTNVLNNNSSWKHKSDDITFSISETNLKKIKSTYNVDTDIITEILKKCKTQLKNLSNDDEAISKNFVWFPYIDKEKYRVNGLNFIQTQFPAIQQHTINPKSTSLITANGNIMCVGLKNNLNASVENVVQKLSNVLQKPIKITKNEIVNIIVTFNVPFKLNNRTIVDFFQISNIVYSANYNSFSGCFVKLLVPPDPINCDPVRYYSQKLPVTLQNYRAITLLFFPQDGKCVLLGNQNIQDWNIARNLLMGFFINFSSGPKALSDNEVRKMQVYLKFNSLEWYDDVSFFLKTDNLEKMKEECANSKKTYIDSTYVNEKEFVHSYLLGNYKFKKSDFEHETNEHKEIQKLFRPNPYGEQKIFDEYITKKNAKIKKQNNEMRQVHFSGRSDKAIQNLTSSSKNTFVKIPSLFNIMNFKDSKVIQIDEESSNTSRVNLFDMRNSAGDPETYACCYRKRYQEKSLEKLIKQQPSLQKLSSRRPYDVKKNNKSFCIECRKHCLLENVKTAS